MLVLVLSTIFFAVPFYDAKVFAGNSETEKYERDYLSKVFDSENGLEGTTANCICADQDGFLWLGGYTGLYRYDGNEFKKFLMDGRALPVNDIVQDQDGILWVGTNGGLFSIDAVGEADRANEYRKFSNSIIQDIGELSTGEKIIIQTVNSIQPYENRIYVGCDDGLYCYEGKKQVKDKLVRFCKGQRTGDQ